VRIINTSLKRRIVLLIRSSILLFNVYAAPCIIRFWILILIFIFLQCVPFALLMLIFLIILDGHVYFEIDVVLIFSAIEVGVAGLAERNL